MVCVLLGVEEVTVFKMETVLAPALAPALALALALAVLALAVTLAMLSL